MQDNNLVSLVDCPTICFTEYAGTEVGDLIIFKKKKKKQKSDRSGRTLFVRASKQNTIRPVMFFQDSTKLYIQTAKLDTDLYGKPSINLYTHQRRRCQLPKTSKNASE